MTLGAGKLGFGNNNQVTYVTGATEFDSSNTEGLSDAFAGLSNTAIYQDTTLSVWIKPATITSGTLFEYSFSDYESSAYDHYPIFRVRLGNTGALIIEASKDNYQSSHSSQVLYQATTANGVITADVWQHVCLTLDSFVPVGITCKMQLFVDGVRITPTINSDPQLSTSWHIGWQGDNAASQDGNFSNFRISVGCQSREDESPDFTDHYNGQLTQLWVGPGIVLVQSHQISSGEDSTSSSTTEAGIRLFYDGGIVNVGKNGGLPNRKFEAINTSFNANTTPPYFRFMDPPWFYYSGTHTEIVTNMAGTHNTATITDVSKTNPAIVTVSAGHNLDMDINQDVIISGVSGFRVDSTPVSDALINDEFRADWQTATTLYLTFQTGEPSDHMDSEKRLKLDVTFSPGYASGLEDYVSGGTVSMGPNPVVTFVDGTHTSGGVSEVVALTSSGTNNAPSSITGMSNLPNKIL